MTDVMVLDSSIDYAVGAWLNDKRGRSGSEETLRKYGRYMESFRRALHNLPADLDAEPRLIRQVAVMWAQSSSNRKEVTSGTFNIKIAVLSSFYEYAIRNELLRLEHNPMAKITRRTVQKYASVFPVSVDTLRVQLDSLRRSDASEAIRDLAILTLALTTGRRVSEIAQVRLEDIEAATSGVTVHWPRAKGGKQMHDILGSATAEALLRYIELAKAEWPETIESDTIWRSMAWNGTKGHILSNNALRDICQRRLGTSKFHRLRHTFAVLMEEDGARLSDIQARLGHSSAATTGIYLNNLRSSDNPHSAGIESRLGF